MGKAVVRRSLMVASIKRDLAVSADLTQQPGQMAPLALTGGRLALEAYLLNNRPRSSGFP